MVTITLLTLIVGATPTRNIDPRWQGSFAIDTGSVTKVVAALEELGIQSGASCELIVDDKGEAHGHACYWPSGELLTVADFAAGLEIWLYYGDGSINMDCVFVEGRFDCAEWNDAGQRLTAIDRATRRAQTQQAGSTDRDWLDLLIDATNESTSEVPHQQLRGRWIERARELWSLGFSELEIPYVLYDEMRGEQPIDARPMHERVSLP